MPREVERALVVELIPSQKLAAMMSGEGQSNFTLGGGIAEYKDDWTLVSHTFEIQQMVRRYSRSSSSAHAPIAKYSSNA